MGGQHVVRLGELRPHAKRRCRRQAEHHRHGASLQRREQFAHDCHFHQVRRHLDRRRSPQIHHRQPGRPRRRRPRTGYLLTEGPDRTGRSDRFGDQRHRSGLQQMAGRKRRNQSLQRHQRRSDAAAAHGRTGRQSQRQIGSLRWHLRRQRPHDLGTPRKRRTAHRGPLHASGPHGHHPQPHGGCRSDQRLHGERTETSCRHRRLLGDCDERLYRKLHLERYADHDRFDAQSARRRHRRLRTLQHHRLLQLCRHRLQLEPCGRHQRCRRRSVHHLRLQELRHHPGELRRRPGRRYHRTAERSNHPRLREPRRHHTDRRRKGRSGRHRRKQPGFQLDRIGRIAVSEQGCHHDQRR